MTVKDLLDKVIYPETTTFEIIAKGDGIDGDYDVVSGNSLLMDFIKNFEVCCWKAVGEDRIRIKIW